MTESTQNFRYLSSSATDVGCTRALNEDALLERPEIGLWAIADGMGGHESGDLASQTIIESLFRIEPALDPAGFLRDVQWRIRVAHQALRREAARRETQSTIGSTVVALLISGQEYTCVWAGDSRAYLLRDGKMSQITRDHSLVQEMVEAGQLEPEQAESHPRANVITRAVGAAEDLELERRTDRFRPGDRIMLCSDGLTRQVPEAEIAEILRNSKIAEAAPALVQVALEHKTRDNVSVIVVACEPAGENEDDLADTLPRASRRSAASLSDLDAGAGAPEAPAASIVPEFATERSGDAELDRILSVDSQQGKDSRPEVQKSRIWGGLFGRFRASDEKKD
jgi:serine/threonine protein phosphatase PrpC